MEFELLSVQWKGPGVWIWDYGIES